MLLNCGKFCTCRRGAGSCATRTYSQAGCSKPQRCLEFRDDSGAGRKVSWMALWGKKKRLVDYASCAG